MHLAKPYSLLRVLLVFSPLELPSACCSLSLPTPSSTTVSAISSLQVYYAVFFPASTSPLIAALVVSAVIFNADMSWNYCK